MKRIALLLGTISILISLITWGMDLTHLVEPCIYCRVERTIIGLLGIIILLPSIRYLSLYLGFVLGFFGASTAAQQIMLLLSNKIYLSIELPLASAALIIIIAQVFFITYWHKS